MFIFEALWVSQVIVHRVYVGFMFFSSSWAGMSNG
jgi:hypothetical protein